MGEINNYSSMNSLHVNDMSQNDSERLLTTILALFGS